MKKIIFFILMTLFFSFCFILNAYCEGGDQNDTIVGEIPEGYYDLLDELPDDVGDKLPDDIYSDDTEKVGEALIELTSAEYIFSMIEELFRDGISDTAIVIARICGILVISAIFSSVRSSLESDAVSEVMRFCSSCAIFASVIDLQYRQISMVAVFFERLNSIMVSMIPITGAIYAMGGNISTATVSGGGMYAFLTVSEIFCGKTVVPISYLCSAFALCRSVAPSINLRGLANGIKKCYTFLLGLIMTILVSLLSTQTSLTAAADNTVARAAKMLTSSMIPVVGGSVSDTLRTVASSVQYMKSIVGVSGIAFVLILLLPTLISLILTRFAFMASEAIADLLGCENESKLMGDLGGVYGCMIATVSMSSVMFILALTIFIKVNVAVL